MRLFFILFFSSLLFQVQAQVLIEYPINQDMDRFDWQAFIDEENIQKHIAFRNQGFRYLGVGPNVLTDLNLDKLDLIRLEIELDLYKQGIKQGLSGEEIQQAKEAIRRHWENVKNIESQIRGYAGLEITGDKVNFAITPVQGVENIEDYRMGAWELYKGDRDVVFNMVEKKDEDLYEALGESDELYAGFITPYVEKYTEKMEGLGQKYYSSLESAYEGEAEFDAVNVMRLMDMYSDSLEIHDCFKENFVGWTDGTQQRALEKAVKGWHTQQGLLGMKSYVEGYRNYKDEFRYSYGGGIDAVSVVSNVFQFRKAPEEVREKMIDFYRNDIFDNEEIKASKEKTHLRARVNALIGLRYLNALNEEEKRIFDRAIEEGIIRNPRKNTFFGSTLLRPFPP